MIPKAGIVDHVGGTLTCLSFTCDSNDAIEVYLLLLENMLCRNAIKFTILVHVAIGTAISKTIFCYIVLVLGGDRLFLLSITSAARPTESPSQQRYGNDSEWMPR